jgi:hypothetical protein
MLAREAVEFARTDPDKLTPDHREAYRLETLAARKFAGRRAVIESGIMRGVIDDAGFQGMFAAGVRRGLP